MLKMRMLAIFVVLNASAFLGVSSIISRSEWGARSPRSTSRIGDNIRHVFVHHSAGSTCNTRSQCERTVRSIQNYHMDTRGWSDIGYSFLIGGDGNVYEGRGWNAAGAHTYGYNRRSYGICFMGNFNNHAPSGWDIIALIEVISIGELRGKIDSFYELHGHKDVSSTQCPGRELYSLIQNLPNYSSSV